MSICKKLEYSPGFVMGIAAGDKFRILNDDDKFEVIERAENVFVQIYSSQSIGQYLLELKKNIVDFNGSIDGSIENFLMSLFTATMALAGSSVMYTIQSME
jgi:hypothetical protein